MNTMYSLMAEAEAAAAAGGTSTTGTAPVATAASSPTAASDAKPVAAATSAPIADPTVPPTGLITESPPKLDAEGKPIPAETKPEVKPDAPVKYEPFKMPEGVVANEKLLTEFSEVAAANKIPQDAAQKMVDIYANAVKEANDSPYRLWADTQKQWQETVRADPELGGDNFDTMRATIANAIDRVGGKEAEAARNALNFTGAGNNPDIIRLIYRFALPYSEGGQVEGRPAAVDKKTFAQTLYPADPAGE